jgi:transcriptional regulator with XRE-family HTH domain
MQTTIVLKDRARELRKAAGLSQKELGEVLGLSQNAISTIESGSRGTTIEKLVLLAEFFHVSTDYLLGITDDPAWRGGPLE